MSIDAVISRVSQMQAMLAAGPSPPATPPASPRPASPSQLQSATGAARRSACAAQADRYRRVANATSTGAPSFPPGTPYGRRDHGRREGERDRPGAARRPGQAGVGLQPERRLRRRRPRPDPADARHRGRPGRDATCSTPPSRSTAAPSTSSSSSTPSAATSPRRSPPTTPAPAPCSASAASRRTPRPRTTSASCRPTPRPTEPRRRSALHRHPRSLRDLRPMTTDRTAAPPRSTALAERSASAADAPRCADRRLLGPAGCRDADARAPSRRAASLREQPPRRHPRATSRTVPTSRAGPTSARRASPAAPKPGRARRRRARRRAPSRRRTRRRRGDARP